MMSPINEYAQPVQSVEPVVFPSARTSPESNDANTGVANNPAPQAHLIESLNRTSVWDVPFDSVALTQAVDYIGSLIRRGTPSYVITANLNYVMLHHYQAELQAVTDQADLVLADGQPIVWRSKLDSNPLPERVAGSEMIFDLAHRASLNEWGIYFLGGEPGVAQACADKLAYMYPGLRIAGVESPPFRQLTKQEQAEQDKRIRRSNAQILLVAFGQPKGELWIHHNYKRLGVPVSIQLGASFDFIAGNAKRAPQIFQRLGLEWAYRMCSDPKRLIPRYTSNGIFLVQSLIRDWTRKVERWGFGIESSCSTPD